MIIGESGSGKSSLPILLCYPGKLMKHAAKIRDEYQFRCEEKPTDPIVVKQGDLQSKYSDGDISGASLFESLENSGFSGLVRSYASSVKEILQCIRMTL